MIYRSGHSVLVQGITGKQGSFWTQNMQACGTNVVGGVNPKRAGERILGVPIYGSAVDAAWDGAIDISVIFIPPLQARAAVIDAIDARIRTIVVLTEHIPTRDIVDIHARARASQSRIIGPNTAGIVTPGEGFVGIMPGGNAEVFQPGSVGVISRSGSLGTLICLDLSRAGLGQSAFIGIGGDPLIGTTTRDALIALDRDPRTRAVALIGEIGGSMEEDAADYARGMTKPVVAFIAGRAAPPDKKMGHAGAIVSGGRGGYDSKRAALEAAGVRVTDTPNELARALAGLLAPSGVA
ncbi:succinyl-CoA synthetase alpha subunit [Rhodopseudomonas rhenobacensis]|uniref:Succinyl-CoA synthetase alpha subunit n=1 Tax=Rhodopseudomonas rhenobacensis TaxID=87461 RepID=A0A7W8DYJ5_9BRAD|nr:succinate--CoA ligase subunit alpha [Rhodopseudomonas rhenobacensis]MBB5046910.1 succinyl-CoA synthetase alpha subunit [Rhodopseudomonas rhenobacensis]